MGKIVFIDVDGTLVDYEGNLPASAAAASVHSAVRPRLARRSICSISASLYSSVIRSLIPSHLSFKIPQMRKRYKQSA